jgi:hypothetical protein
MMAESHGMMMVPLGICWIITRMQEQEVCHHHFSIQEQEVYHHLSLHLSMRYRLGKSLIQIFMASRIIQEAEEEVEV